MFVPELRYTVTEYDPQRPWVMVTQTRGSRSTSTPKTSPRGPRAPGRRPATGPNSNPARSNRGPTRSGPRLSAPGTRVRAHRFLHGSGEIRTDVAADPGGVVVRTVGGLVTIRAMSHATQDLVTSIDERLAQARAEIASLEAALLAFATQPAPSRPRRHARRQSASATAARAGSRRARSTSTTTHAHFTPARARKTGPGRAVDVDAARLQALLGDHDGLTTTAIADHTGANRIRILAVLRRLETDGQIRRTGVRRSTRWHTITDEDRIAQRAAQLARQSKAAGDTITRPARRAARRS